MSNPGRILLSTSDTSPIPGISAYTRNPVKRVEEDSRVYVTYLVNELPQQVLAKLPMTVTRE